MKKGILVTALVMLTIVFTSKSQTADPPASGDGTSGNPYQIATLNNLFWLSQNIEEWDKHYIQTADIDASATSGWDSGNGFSPIGISWQDCFSGSYNGKRHIIDGLYINRVDFCFLGLFGYTVGSVTDSLGVTNVNISGRSNIGGLTGVSREGSSITNCYSTGNVSGALYYVGGLVGEQALSCTIEKCYSTASASGGMEYVGGLVGISNQSVISNSYSTGSSNGSGHVGGLVGRSFSSSSVLNCYSTGVPGGNNDVGGLVGSQWSMTICNSFWDTLVSGLGTSAGGSGITTAEMQLLCTYVDSTWDFIDETINGTDDIWGMNSSENGAYPFLAWQGYQHTEYCCSHEDNTNPDLTVQDFTAELDSSGNVNITVSDVVISATDNCEVADTSLSQYSFNCSSVGARDIDVTLSDAMGNQVTLTSTITVLDNTDPTISCIGNQQVSLSEGQTEYTVAGTEFDPVSIQDNCETTIINDYNSSASLTGASLPVGSTTITWIATDDSGNTGNCSFDVQVDAYVGIAMTDIAGEIVIYPNPVQDMVIINSGNLVINNICVDGLTGKTIDRFVVNDNTFTIDLSSYAEGMYFIRLYTNEGIILKKIIKTHRVRN